MEVLQAAYLLLWKSDNTNVMLAGVLKPGPLGGSKRPKVDGSSKLWI